MKYINYKIKLALFSAGVLVLSGCAGSGNTTPTESAVINVPTNTVTASPSVSASPSKSSSASPSASSTSSDDATVLRTAMTPMGEIIVGKDGMTVYYFTNDVKGSDKSNCEGKCIENWPPVISESGNPKVEGITAEIDTIDTADGQKHVTVNGMPVYYWVKDKNAGDVTGQGVQNVWYVVAPDGTMIESAAPATGVEATASPSANG